MKRLRVYIMLMLCLLLATSCSIGGDRTRMLNESNEKEESQDTLELILDSIATKDSESLKSIFSSQALKEVDYFDRDIEYLFEFFQGEVNRWEIRTGPQVSETNDHGKKTKEMKTWYEVETDTNNYIVFILEYTGDTEHSENLGVYALRIVNKEDEDTQMTFWQDMVIPGIYRPDK